MIRISGGTFRMGSDHHYPEEAPAHRVSVDTFWLDPTPITNSQFKAFVNATGHVTIAEIPPDPADYPGALPQMLYAGSLVFSPPPRVTDLRDWSQWWNFMKGANWRRPYGPGSNINGLDDHPVVHVALRRCARLCRDGRARTSRPKRSGNSPRAAASTSAEFAWGNELTPGGKHMANTWQGEFPDREPQRGRLRAHLAGDGVSAERLRRARHDRERLGMDLRLVCARSNAGRRAEGLLHSAKSARRPRRRQLRPVASRTSGFRARC